MRRPGKADSRAAGGPNVRAADKADPRAAGGSNVRAAVKADPRAAGGPNVRAGANLPAPWSEARVAVAVILAFVAVKVVLTLAVPSGWDFHRDELLYLALGRHPALGYWSNGPLIGWVAWALQAVTTASIDAVRLVPLAASATTLAVTGWMARRMGGGAKAVALACLGFLLSPGFLRTGVLFQPVVLDVLWWTCGTACLVGFLSTAKKGWIVALGPIMGLGLLTKYSMLFFAVALLAAVAVSPERRRIVSGPAGIAALVAAALFLPNVAWQAASGWPVVTHLRELSVNQLGNVTSADFLLDQFLTYLPALPIWIAGLAWTLRRSRFRPVGWFYLVTVGLMLALSGKSYYTMGAYPVLIAAGGVALARRRSAVAWAVSAFALVVGAAAGPFSLPFLGPARMVEYADGFARVTGTDAPRRWEDGSFRSLPQDYADMMAWREIADLARAAVDAAPDSGVTAIYAENYGQAGAIEHHGRAWGLGPVISFQDSYRLWAPDSLPPNLQAMVYVNDEPGEDVLAGFREVRLVGRIGDPRAREVGTGVYLCQGPTQAFRDRYARIIASVRATGERPDG